MFETKRNRELASKNLAAEDKVEQVVEEKKLSCDAPSKQFEDLRRKVFSDTKDISFFMNAHLDSMIKSNSIKQQDLVFLKENLNERAA